MSKESQKKLLIYIIHVLLLALTAVVCNWTV